MKIYKMEILFIDFDGLGEAGARDLLENTRYPNHVIGPDVMSCETREVDWTDAHPLNNRTTRRAAYEKLFKK